MTPREDLLSQFESLTTPETPATPTFQQSGTGNVQVHILGNDNRVGLPGSADRVADGFVRWIKFTAPIAAILMAVAVAYLALSAGSGNSVGFYLGIMASALVSAAAAGTLCAIFTSRSTPD